MKTNIRLQILKIFPILLIVLLLSTACKNKYEGLDLESYQYQDTKDLLKFVYNSAKQFEEGGLQRLEYFKKNRKYYNNGNRYLYIYKMDGTNVFHAGMPHLEGTNLKEVIDKNGKKITYLVLEALQNKNNPYAWVHYLWWAPGKFYPVPKSSCHFQVTIEDGTEYFVGGGLDYPQEEKEFVRIIVDSAVENIKQNGMQSLEELSDPLSQYNYRDVRIFAFQKNGKILISPVTNDNLEDLQLLEFTDEVNHKPFAKALRSLQNKDSTWEVFMAKNRFQRVLIKKCLYIKKVDIDGKLIFVGAITNLPQPPWTG